jgi:quercetin 2,3-dioxygenase
VPGAAELVEPREVPLGGPRSMLVRRTLPDRRLPTIGPWCFVDQYGPDPLADGPGMQVPPHPHTGLQTVSWLVRGEVLHRDSLGTVATIRPGDLLLMTSGHGIAHSEQSTAGPGALHGVQLWVALPAAHRGVGPHVEHHRAAELPQARLDGARVTVLLGEPAGDLAGARSPAHGYSPIVGAQLVLPAGGALTMPLEPEFEHGFVVLAGAARVDGVEAGVGSLVHLPPGARSAALQAGDGADLVLLMIGGTPFEDPLVMWWNFVGPDHDAIVEAREDWQADRRFGEVTGYPGDRLKAPVLPGVRLRPRTRR